MVRANSPGRVAISTPIFVGQVIGDPLIKPERTRLFMQNKRATNVTYCEYDTIDNTNVFNNHDALRRMRDASALCKDFDAARTPKKFADRTPITMIEWFKRNYRP